MLGVQRVLDSLNRVPRLHQIRSARFHGAECRGSASHHRDILIGLVAKTTSKELLVSNPEHLQQHAPMCNINEQYVGSNGVLDNSTGCSWPLS